MAISKTNSVWNHEYNTLRRQNLYENPPNDHSAHPLLQTAVDPHIESFNAIFKKGGLLEHGLQDIGTKVLLDNANNKLYIRYKGITLLKPQVPPTNKWAKHRAVYPSECRERHSTYRGRLLATIQYCVNSGPQVEIVRDIGQLPIMLKSSYCYLANMPPSELVHRKEESEELGGYFVVNGNEKLIRLLLLNRRNFPLAIDRPSFANRGPNYTTFGIILRSVRPDETSQTNVLHYLKDGTIIFRFSWRKNEYLIPVVLILKALVDTNDMSIFQYLGGAFGQDETKKSWLANRIELLLRNYKTYNIYTKSKARAYLGDKFRGVLAVPETKSNYEAGTEFLRRIVLVHLGNINVTEEQDWDKFNMILFMIRKLYALVGGECAVDNPDAVQNQEILLGGFLYGQILKERLDELLSIHLRNIMRDYVRRHPSAFTSDNFHQELISTIFRRINENIGNALEYFLSTGNLQSHSGLDLQQTSGFTVVAEKLNFLRFLSHFRMVHRGSFFQTLKTTTVRKLLPESWGFLCPVHTPDGGPCGLLNHLAHRCKIMTEAADVSAIYGLVVELGVTTSPPAPSGDMVVMLDGRVIGWCKPSESRRITDTLRYWKVEGSHAVPKHLEIGHVPYSNGGSYPGIYMSSAPARMVRPVIYLPLSQEDFVGPHEQPYMSIAVRHSEVISGETTHVEVHPTNILSILANMTPFSDFNQSPRNMYQCQMGKQTMGTPGTALRFRTDNKLYLLQTGQTPIVRSPLHNDYGFDHFPNGTNAVVAVISYTGYDMDDAMIINKSAHERGFGYGSIFKTSRISIKEEGSRARTLRGVTKLFGFNPIGNNRIRDHCSKLDEDGLPCVGQKLEAGDPLYAWYSVKTDYNEQLVPIDAETHIERYKDTEAAYISEVRLIGNENGNEPLQVISVKYRVPRSPVIGDKFSSRHGQKGVCSQKWPVVDMPFSESGIQPDVIINPHAFPSRMTIGMFVESLAGKAGALHGLAQDSTPFQFDEDHTAADFFGHQLMKAGYNYHGNEPMYSGITGQELHADIYIGVVFYQRLRHMVNDKFQVRTTGPVVPTTGQPIKGRKRGGGIRVGEMERDSLLAHGTSFLLQDRLMNCSDYSVAWACRNCGSFLSTQPAVTAQSDTKRRTPLAIYCRRCARRVDEVGIVGSIALSGETWEDGQGQLWVGGTDTTQVAIPGALKYLDVELASMGIKLCFNVSKRDATLKKPPSRKLVKDVQVELGDMSQTAFGPNRSRTRKQQSV